MEEHVASWISIRAVCGNYRCAWECSCRAVRRYRAACVWIKQTSQSLGGNFKVKRKSRLIRCTRWTLHSAAVTTSSLCFPVTDQTHVPFSRKGRVGGEVRELGSSVGFANDPVHTPKSVHCTASWALGISTNEPRVSPPGSQGPCL